jgi:hypothetical protein
MSIIYNPVSDNTNPITLSTPLFEPKRHVTREAPRVKQQQQHHQHGNKEEEEQPSS